jgi:hypothetical protein
MAGAFNGPVRVTPHSIPPPMSAMSLLLASHGTVIGRAIAQKALARRSAGADIVVMDDGTRISDR